jgi:beta,beta-carotene 9',10'-dioxygenase
MTARRFHTGFATLKHEVASERLPIAGALPTWLSGTLLRTGPAQFEVGQESYRHWFDGLAMLHRFSIADGAVSYANRFLHSHTYRDNTGQGRIAHGEFATDPCRSLFKRIMSAFSRDLTDNGNVNVAELGDAFVALTEAPLPVMFDPRSLEALGRLAFADDLAGQITTAHPHHDGKRGAINYLAHLSARSSYNVYALPTGERRRRLLAKVPSDAPAYMHSFAMTEHFVVLVEFPLVVNPLEMALKPGPFIEHYHWRPERQARFLVIDKAAGSVVGRHLAEPFFAFHHINAFERNGAIVVDIAAYPDPTIVQDFYLENLIGPKSRGVSQGALRRYVLPIEGDGPVAPHEVLSEESFELPRINYGQSNGRDYRFAYGSGRRKDTPDDFMNQLVKVDVLERTTRRWFEEGCYPGEAIFVPAPGAIREDEGVLLSIVLDGNRGSSFLLVLDGASFTELARAEVPHHIPFSFHGTYTSKRVA